MRQKTRNALFTFLYPGRAPGSGIDRNYRGPHVAIPDEGEWVSICGERYGGEQSSAVFYDPQSLRDLAEVLNEAADLFEEAKRKNGEGEGKIMAHRRRNA